MLMYHNDHYKEVQKFHLNWALILKNSVSLKKQGRKRPLDTPKRMVEKKRERRRERERKVQEEI